MDHLRVLEGCDERCLLFGRTWKWLSERTDGVENPTVLTACLKRCHHHWHFVTIVVISLLVGCASEEND